MSFQTMSRKEADKITDTLVELLTVEVTPWQREIFAVLLMYPDVKFELGHRRGF